MHKILIYSVLNDNILAFTAALMKVSSFQFSTLSKLYSIICRSNKRSNSNNNEHTSRSIVVGGGVCGLENGCECNKIVNATIGIIRKHSAVAINPLPYIRTHTYTNTHMIVLTAIFLEAAELRWPSFVVVSNFNKRVWVTAVAGQSDSDSLCVWTHIFTCTYTCPAVYNMSS